MKLCNKGRTSSTKASDSVRNLRAEPTSLSIDAPELEFGFGELEVGLGILLGLVAAKPHFVLELNRIPRRTFSIGLAECASVCLPVASAGARIPIFDRAAKLRSRAIGASELVRGG
jgi:hypothetical protein